jgi:UDP-N-acetylmuramyl tripeptide synthase
MERIEVGQDFIAMVDYAPEPESMRQLQEAADEARRHSAIAARYGLGRAS